MQASNNENLLFLREFELLASASKRSIKPLCKWSIETIKLFHPHLFKVVNRLENIRQQEIQQRPELRKTVLKRSPCQQQTPWRVVWLNKNSGKLIFVVLHAMSFVYDKIFPSYTAENCFVANNVLVGRQQDVELGCSNLVCYHAASISITAVDDFRQGWRPFLKLQNPIGERW